MPVSERWHYGTSVVGAIVSCMRELQLRDDPYCLLLWRFRQGRTKGGILVSDVSSLA
jgi:hypothetical protein